MRNIIILKGERNTGKSKTLKEALPPIFDYPIGYRSLRYQNKWILIIRRSIHESPDWKDVVKKIIDYKDHIIVIAAWLDEIVEESKCVKNTLEKIIKAKLSHSDEVNFDVVYTKYQDNEKAQKLDHKRCANEIKEIVDSI